MGRAQVLQEYALHNSKVWYAERNVWLARQCLIDFIEVTFPAYSTQWFHELLCDKLDQLLTGDLKKLMVFMPPQHGKFLPANTPVLTTKGWKPHGELAYGDCVFGQDGKPKKVIATTSLYKWPVVTIDFQQGQSIQCAKEHLWKIMVADSNNNRHEQICETKTLYSYNPKRRSPAIVISPAIEMPDAKLPIDPYLLGVWLGDGTSAAEGDALFYIGKIKALGYDVSKQSVKQRFGILKPFSKQLIALGVLKNKHIPAQYLLASENQRWELLRGLMDTDGYVDKRGRCEFCQKKGRVADEAYTLIRSLGIKCTSKEYEMKLYGRSVGRKVRITFSPGPDDVVFKLPRKVKSLKLKSAGDRKDKYSFFIKSISRKEKIVVGNCIQIDGGMYLAGKDLIPTHNSTIVSRRLPAFALGKNPDLKIIVCSYAADLAQSFNRDVQRIIDEPQYKKLFPETRLSGKNVVADSHTAYKRNSDEFEIVNKKGGLRAAGVEGPISGFPMDLGIIDDPVKGRVEANSAVDQKRKWEWYCDVFSQRMHNNTRILLTMTRWHKKDLAGRILEKEPGQWAILSLPYLKEAGGIAEDTRKVGEALWESRHSAAKALLSKSRSPQSFAALGQQRPVAEGGNLLRIDKVHIIGGICPCGSEHEFPEDLLYKRAWDLASSSKQTAKDDPDFTVGVLGGLIYAPSGLENVKVPILYIKDVVRGQWEATERNDTILQTAIGDGDGVECGIEAFGAYKDAYTTISDLLSGIRTVSDMRLPGDKTAKASPLAPVFQAGNVYLQRAPWNDDFLETISSFPSGGHDDDVDALAVLYFMCKSSSVGDIFTLNDFLRENEAV